MEGYGNNQTRSWVLRPKATKILAKCLIKKNELLLQKKKDWGKDQGWKNGASNSRCSNKNVAEKMETKSPSSLSNFDESKMISSMLGVYRQKCHDAQTLGIPEYALPSLPPTQAGMTVDDIRQADEKLSSIIESYLSAQL